MKTLVRNRLKLVSIEFKINQYTFLNRDANRRLSKNVKPTMRKIADKFFDTCLLVLSLVLKIR